MKRWSCFPLISLIFPQNNDFLKVLWINNVFKSLITTAKKPFSCTFFSPQKLIKKATKMKGTSGNSKIKANKSKLMSSSFWPKFRLSPQATIAMTYSSSPSWNAVINILHNVEGRSDFNIALHKFHLQTRAYWMDKTKRFQ